MPILNDSANKSRIFGKVPASEPTVETILNIPNPVKPVPEVKDKVEQLVNAALTDPTPGLTMVNPVNSIIYTLLNGAKEIHTAQLDYDKTQRTYLAVSSTLSIEALTSMIFTTKDGLPRAASNDTERELAISQVLTRNQNLTALLIERDTYAALLARRKNEFEAAKLLVASGLLTAK